MTKYWMIARNSCGCGNCYPDQSAMHNFEAPSEKDALSIAEAWWHYQLPLHVSRYFLAKNLEVKTTSKSQAMLKEFGKTDSW